MNLRTGVVAIVVAAAAGAAGFRALTYPRASSVPAAPAVSFISSGPAGSASTPLEPRSRPRRPAAASAVVYVAGAVAKPGVYTLAATARVVDALHAAGGPTLAADLGAINLAERVADGQEVAVPVRGAEAATGEGVAARPHRTHRRNPKRAHRNKRRRVHKAAAPTESGGDGSTDVPTETVDVNSADEATLETLPGIGPSLAQRLIAFRDLNGPFASSDELLDVGGMTAGKVDALAPYITF